MTASKFLIVCSHRRVMRPVSASGMVELINEKRAGKVIRRKGRPKGENVVDLMEALRRSVGREASAEPQSAPKTSAKKLRKAASGQKEMLMPIAGKKQAKEVKAKKPVAAKSQRRSA
ncbi:hypothetical protein ACVWZ4_004387 [Bradyrhizobium sp. USDA 4472]